MTQTLTPPPMFSLRSLTRSMNIRKLVSATLTVVNRCWEMLNAAADPELDRLGGRHVVPGRRRLARIVRTRCG